MSEYCKDCESYTDKMQAEIERLKQDKARLIEALKKYDELIDADMICSWAIEEVLEFKYLNDKLLKEMEGDDG